MTDQPSPFDSPDPAERIQAARAIQTPDAATVRRLEWMAARDPDPAARQAALDVLARPEFARFLRRFPRSNAPQAIRAEMIQQITRWAMTGQLSADQWRVLRGRYLFDFASPPLSAEGRQALNAALAVWQREGLVDADQAEILRRDLSPQPAAPQPAAPRPVTAQQPAPRQAAAPAQAPTSTTPAPAPRRSVLDILFSEVSIRIALYLGGFLVVAAALILAALIQVARMPILLALTAICGGAAVALRKRLPLPAHVLFMLFAALLPIDARVLGDTLRLSAADSRLFWSLTWAVEAAVLGAGGLLYDSRLLALAAFGALDIAAVYAGLRWDIHHPAESITACLALAALASVGWSAALKRVKGLGFALPVVWAGQIQAALALFAALSWLFAYQIDGSSGANRAAVPIPWLAGALVFFLTDLSVVRAEIRVIRLRVLPPLAAGALLFVPYTLLWAFNLPPDTIKAGMAVTALALLAAGTLLVRSGSADPDVAPTNGRRLGPENDGPFLRAYGPWLLASAVGLVAWVTGWQTGDDVVVPFTYLCLWAVSLTASAAALGPRPYGRAGLWAAALLSALLAYFTFFALPFMHDTTLDPRYQALIPALALLLPTLALRPNLPRNGDWHLPLLGFGLLLALAAALMGLFAFDAPRADLLAAAVTVTLLALAALAYALRFRAPWLLFAYGALALGGLCRWLVYAGTDAWMLPAAGLAVAHYAVGRALAGKYARGEGAGASTTAGTSAPASADASAAPSQVEDAVRPASDNGYTQGISGQRVTGETPTGVPAGAPVSGYTQRTPTAARRSGPLTWPAALTWTGLLIALFPLARLPFESALPGAALHTLGGFGLLAAGALYLAEIFRTRRYGFEYPMDALFIAALFLFLQGRGMDRSHLAAAFAGSSLIVLAFDLLFTRFYPVGGAARWLARIAGAALAVLAAEYMAITPGVLPQLAAALFALFALYFLAAGLLYPQPWLAAPATGALAAALFFALKWQGQSHWVAPIVILAALEYGLSWWMGRRLSAPSAAAIGAPAAVPAPGAGDGTGQPGFFRAALRDLRDAPLPTWAFALRISALALAMVVSLTAPLENALSASIPVAAAASLYAIEAFRRRNVWIGFPANGLYLLAYFIILYQLQVSEPQFYSLGVAVLGMLMHYLLVRSGSRAGAFLTGMVSQLSLLGTTYVQMYNTQKLSFFVILFFQGLIVLAYGIAIRSRSLVITPLAFIVLGVVTVVLSILSGVPTAIIIGCTGVLLLVLGILAVVLRERLMEATVKMGEWRA